MASDRGDGSQRGSTSSDGRPPFATGEPLKSRWQLIVSGLLLALWLLFLAWTALAG